MAILDNGTPVKFFQPIAVVPGDQQATQTDKPRPLGAFVASSNAEGTAYKLMAIQSNGIPKALGFIVFVPAGAPIPPGVNYCTL